MASNAPAYPMDSKESESMQQAPTAPPMGPPPTYTEAMNSSPYPPMPVAATSQSAPYPTSASAPYPTSETIMPVPVQVAASTAPYPLDDNVIPQPMTQVHPAMSVPLHDTHNYAQSVGFNSSSSAPIHQQHGYQAPIVNQPAAYHDEYVHPKTTYVVLQDERHRRRNNDDGECSCTDWLMCCWCCVETCRCMLLCVECAATCK